MRKYDKSYIHWVGDYQYILNMYDFNKQTIEKILINSINCLDSVLLMWK